jgi:hypothetical protein
MSTTTTAAEATDAARGEHGNQRPRPRAAADGHHHAR